MRITAHSHKLRWWQLAILVCLFPLLLAILALAVLLFVIASVSLHTVIWLWWCGRGRDILFVYSDSPTWHDYIEQQILPRLGERAVVLNWSHRKRWRLSLARLAFRHFGGYRQFNPLGVVFRPFARTRTFRFWQPFQDFKHGHPEALQKMENEFCELIRARRHEPSA